MRNPRKTILTLCLCAAAAFAMPCFAQAVQPAVPDKATPAPTAKPNKPKLAAKSTPAQLIDIKPAAIYFQQDLGTEIRPQEMSQ